MCSGWASARTNAVQVAVVESDVANDVLPFEAGLYSEESEQVCPRPPTAVAVCQFFLVVRRPGVRRN
eukprot:7391140-Lingulodinium_polyedra.AAC.1